jgi:hypothetical protein
VGLLTFTDLDNAVALQRRAGLWATHPRPAPLLANVWTPAALGRLARLARLSAAVKSSSPGSGRCPRQLRLLALHYLLGLRAIGTTVFLRDTAYYGSASIR